MRELEERRAKEKAEREREVKEAAEKLAKKDEKESPGSDCCCK